MTVKIASWNLCLGLPNKKDLVVDDLINNDISICCMQETELSENLPTDILNSKFFYFEPEKSTIKKRVGVYINEKLSYNRIIDLEENNRHVIIIDLNLDVVYRVISLYRSFRPLDQLSTIEFFRCQMAIVEKNITHRTIILGDFNLDLGGRYRADYTHRHIYNVLNDFLDRNWFYQMVNFPTWSRIINNVKKESTLDHIYVSDPTFVNSCSSWSPLFGDHLVVAVEHTSKNVNTTKTIYQDWRSYTPTKLINLLKSTNLLFMNDSVQEYWNSLENVLINAIDDLAPLSENVTYQINKSTHPFHIRAKMNKRKKLLKKNRIQFNPETTVIKTLNREIKTHFFNNKCRVIHNKIK